VTDEGKREEKIFWELLELEDPEERNRYLQNACGGDKALCERLTALLEATGRTDRFFGHVDHRRTEAKSGRQDLKTLESMIALAKALTGSTAGYEESEALLRDAIQTRANVLGVNPRTPKI